MDKILSNIPEFILRVVLFFVLLWVLVTVVEWVITLVIQTKKFINDSVGEMTDEEFEQYLQDNYYKSNARLIDGKTDKYDITIDEVNSGLFRYEDENKSFLNYVSVTYTIHNKQEKSIYFKDIVKDEIVIDGLKSTSLPVTIYNDENNTVVNNDISTEIEYDEIVTITKYYARNSDVKEVEVVLIDRETKNIILDSIYST